jgi:PAS domain S-box-containing protein
MKTARQSSNSQREQKIILEAQIEASPDGVLLVGSDGNIISFNRRFTELWRIPKSILAKRSDKEALDYAKNQLANPREFIRRVAYLYKHPREKSEEEILLKDGRTFDRYSTPVKGLRGNYLGRVWFFRDITRRKKAESELQRLENAILESTEMEQRRIGQDLHDSLGQHLTGVSFLSHALQQKLVEKAFPESKEAGRITDLIDQATQKIRQITRGLYPVLDSQGLVFALQSLAENTTDLFRIPCRFQSKTPVPRLDPTTESHLYRIAQEAVTNAIKHAKAKNVWIKLSAKDKLVLSVRDNGVGLPKRRPLSKGMGLHIMTYRASKIGGAVEIKRARPRGTRVLCTFPL